MILIKECESKEISQTVPDTPCSGYARRSRASSPRGGQLGQREPVPAAPTRKNNWNHACKQGREVRSRIFPPCAQRIDGLQKIKRPRPARHDQSSCQRFTASDGILVHGPRLSTTYAPHHTVPVGMQEFNDKRRIRRTRPCTGDKDESIRPSYQAIQKAPRHGN